MRRFLCLWFPRFPTDRWRRQRVDASAGPLVLTARGKGGIRLAAVDFAAAALGLFPGMSLADARALAPAIAVEEAEPDADAKSLAALADWCRRYSPWSAVDGADGVRLDITGCAHLFEGEPALLVDARRRLAAFGFTAVHGAIADTPAAAWGWARYRRKGVRAVLAPGDFQPLLALPVEALRLEESEVETLKGLGLDSVGAVAALPRAPLGQRLGDAVLRRLDQLFGRAAEPISPHLPAAPWLANAIFAEPIARREDIDAVALRLVERLCKDMALKGAGARRLELSFYRVDSTVQRLAIGTSRGTHESKHLLRLFAERLETVEPDFGIEAMTLEATEAEPLAPQQSALSVAGEIDAADLAALIDRLKNRLGPGRVVQLVPVESHMPERAEAWRPAVSSYPKSASPLEGEVGNATALTGGGTRAKRLKTLAVSNVSAPVGGEARDTNGRRNHLRLVTVDTRSRHPPPVGANAPLTSPSRGEAFVIRSVKRKKAANHRPFPRKSPRPLKLLTPPEPIEAAALIPDDPPLSFRWRRVTYRVVAADGPERIGPEWWLPATSGKPRDYYRVEDAEGRRFWLYREGLYDGAEPPRWFLHGFFA